MTCFEFEEQLQAQLDLRVQNYPEDLVSHAAICGACSSLLEQLQRINAVTSRWPEIDSPANFSTSAMAAWKSNSAAKTTTSMPDLIVIAAVEPERHSTIAHKFETHSLPPRPAVPSASWALIASTIAMCVIFGAGLRVSQNVPYAHHRIANDVIVANNHSSSPETQISASDRQLDVLLNDAQEAYSALVSQALQHASTASFLLPPAETTSPFRSNDAMNGFPDSLSQPLSPWGHELRDAFDSLLDRIFSSQDSST